LFHTPLRGASDAYVDDRDAGEPLTAIPPPSSGQPQWARGPNGDGPPAFLASHRAVAACAREFTRLAEEVIERVSTLAAATGDEKAVVRQSPARCIVQLGPVALTLTWLRKTLDSVADGELLVIGWHGAVAPRGLQTPERAPLRAPSAAIALWEELLVAVADNEASWLWRRQGASNGFQSATLADGWVERLRLAYDACRTGAATSSDPGHLPTLRPE
jgi:hypothetical protein